MFNIEKLRPCHLTACVRMIGSTPLFKAYGLTASGARRMLAEALATNDNDLIVATSDKKVLGLAWIAKKGSFLRAPYLRLIAVEPRRTGQGVGKALLDTLESRYVGIFLLVTQTNSGARRFYRKRGYRRVGDIPHFVKQGITECLYYKPRSSS